MVTEVKAELLVTQAALAVALAGLARLSADPKASVAEVAMEILVFGRAVGSGLNGPTARPEAMSAVADRIAGWAEAMVVTTAH
jgi:hypothetical protein